MRRTDERIRQRREVEGRNIVEERFRIYLETGVAETGVSETGEGDKIGLERE
jgi:hypothetical protein